MTPQSREHPTLCTFRPSQPSSTSNSPSAKTPDSRSDLHPPEFSWRYTHSPSTTFPFKMRTCSTTSQTLSSTPRMLRSQPPASSTRTVSPVWKNEPIRWLSTLSLIPSKLCSRPCTYSATPGLSREPTRHPPSPSARSAGSMVTSNHYAKRSRLPANFAPSNTPRPIIAAPTPHWHAPAEETLKPYLDAASPPLPDGPTVGKRTRPGARTAPNDRPLWPPEPPPSLKKTKLS